MPFDIRSRTDRPSFRHGPLGLLLRLPTWAYIALALGGFLYALTEAVR